VAQPDSLPADADLGHVADLSKSSLHGGHSSVVIPEQQPHVRAVDLLPVVARVSASKREVSEHPQDISMRQTGIDRGDEARIHLGHGAEGTRAVPDDVPVAEVQI